MITGRVRILLRQEPDQNNEGCDRRALTWLAGCPDGVEVIVDIGDRQFISQDAAQWLHSHDPRLRIVIEGTDPSAVATFVRAARAARAGEWSVGT